MVKEDTAIIMDVCIKAKLKTMRPMDSGFIMILFKDTNTMESGKMTYLMEKEKKSSKMAHIMRETFFME